MRNVSTSHVFPRMRAHALACVFSLLVFIESLSFSLGLPFLKVTAAELQVTL